MNVQPLAPLSGGPLSFSAWVKTSTISTTTPNDIWTCKPWGTSGSHFKPFCNGFINSEVSTFTGIYTSLEDCIYASTHADGYVKQNHIECSAGRIFDFTGINADGSDISGYSNDVFLTTNNSATSPLVYTVCHDTDCDVAVNTTKVMPSDTWVLVQVVHGADLSVSIYMDGVRTGYKTNQALPNIAQRKWMVGGSSARSLKEAVFFNAEMNVQEGTSFNSTFDPNATYWVADFVAVRSCAAGGCNTNLTITSTLPPCTATGGIEKGGVCRITQCASIDGTLATGNTCLCGSTVCLPETFCAVDQSGSRGVLSCQSAGNKPLPDGDQTQGGSAHRDISSLGGILDRWIAGGDEKFDVMTQYGFIEDWDLSQVTDMKYLLYDRLTFNEDLSKWDVSNVTNMHFLFKGCASFIGDISKWNVSKTKNMANMFESASKFNGDLSKWTTSSLSNMYRMFQFASIFNGNLSNWDVSSVFSMGSLFYNAFDFNGDLSKWVTSNLNRMQHMFFGADKFNGDISEWDVSRVDDMKKTFGNTVSFNGDLSTWDVSNVAEMGEMFASSGFKRTLCGSAWASLRGVFTNSLARLGCCSAGGFMSDPFYSPFSKVNSCKQCPLGWFGSSADNDDTSCVACVSGRFNVNLGSTSCQGICPPGTSSPPGTVNISGCIPVCPAGKYNSQNLLGQAGLNCIDCEPGKVSNADSLSSSDCRDCPPGKRFLALDECRVCSAGQFQSKADVASVVCQICYPGRFIVDHMNVTSEHDSVDDCQYCSAGKEFVSTTQGCQICGGGQYQDQNSVAGVNCTDCPKNTFLADHRKLLDVHTVAGDCIDCVPGKFSPGGQRACETCTGGQELANSSCVKCQAGRFSTAEVPTCQNCSVGYFQSEVGTPYCLPCIRKFYLRSCSSVPSFLNALTCFFSPPSQSRSIPSFNGPVFVYKVCHRSVSRGSRVIFLQQTGHWFHCLGRWHHTVSSTQRIVHFSMCHRRRHMQPFCSVPPRMARYRSSQRKLYGMPTWRNIFQRFH